MPGATGYTVSHNMPRIRPILLAALLGSIVVASIVALIEHPLTTASVVSHIDQSRYAEIATTSNREEASFPPSAAVNIPILVYHIVRPSYPDDSQSVRSLALTPEVFDAEMVYLARAGYHVISFDELERYFTRRAPLPSKPIIISFDDGWKDQFEYALPILEKNHVQATFFVFTNAIGRRGFVSWSDLEKIRDAGMTIGSHSKSHPYLTRIATSSLPSEIRESKHILEQHLGIRVNEFAYPFGKYTESIALLVKQAGYHAARGDFESGKQEVGRLYGLSALNAPTTIAAFEKKFPSTGYQGL